jgi:hypothetical protein
MMQLAIPAIGNLEIFGFQPTDRAAKLEVGNQNVMLVSIGVE